MLQKYSTSSQLRFSGPNSVEKLSSNGKSPFEMTSVSSDGHSSSSSSMASSRGPWKRIRDTVPKIPKEDNEIKSLNRIFLMKVVRKMYSMKKPKSTTQGTHKINATLGFTSNIDPWWEVQGNQCLKLLNREQPPSPIPDPKLFYFFFNSPPEEPNYAFYVHLLELTVW